MLAALAFLAAVLVIPAIAALCCGGEPDNATRHESDN